MKDEMLPAGAAEMLADERKTARFLYLTFAIAAAVGGGLIALGKTVWPSVAVFGFMLGALSLPALLIALLESWRVGALRRQLARFVTGEHLAHWTYTADEWRAFDGTWTDDRPVGETYIAESAAYCNATFMDWNGVGKTLLQIDWHEGPIAELHFYIFYSNPKTGGTKFLFRVPVPRGREDEAQRLRESLMNSKRFVPLPIAIRALWLVVALFSVVVALFAMAVSLGLIK